MSAATDAFVTHGLTAQFSDMSPDALTSVKTFLLDSLGVGIAGARTPLTAPVRRAAKQWGDGAAAHVWGDGAFLASAPTAAFINGFQIHCQEFDCVHEAAVVHPMAVILSAVLAEIERRPNTTHGRDLAISLAVGVDLAAGLGVATQSPIRFFRPANAGLFGATLAIARLRGFDEMRARDALGYALAFCAGTMQAHVEGKPALPLQIANAARSAHMAADLASEGIPGPHDSLEGPFGYLKLFEEAADLSPVADTLGKIWRITEVSHKPFPTGRAAQGGIGLMQKLLALGVKPGEIEQVTLTAPPIIKRLVGRPIIDRMTPNHARLCFQYVGAVALLKGTVGLDDFSENALNDPWVSALGNRITIVDDGSSNPAAFCPQSATARLAGGQTATTHIDALYGSPSDPMTRADHIDKFRSCVTFGFGHQRSDIAEQMINLTDNLETVSDASQLSRLAAGMET
jgi:2-methylcitrate dehydratase PrpD